MIRYQLGCPNDHQFETWFRDSAAFDEQVEHGLLACPACGSNEVTKQIMAPAVVGASGRRDGGPPPPVPMPPASPGNGALLDPRRRAMRAAMSEMRAKILSESHDAGTRFPEEARQMHDGAIPVRPIHGQATPAEARDLIEDGIMILPIPAPPEELN